MRFKTISSRITGFSSPIFGISWDPPEPEIVAARRTVSFLEDRRVLYNPSVMEVPEHCVKSILEIRRYLTSEIQLLSNNNQFSESLRAMRAACRKFMDSVGKRAEIVQFGAQHNHWASWEFNSSLGELRGVFGVHIAIIASAYGLDVEDDLAKILPERISDNEDS